MGNIGLEFDVGFSRDEVRVGGGVGVTRLACERLGTGDWSAAGDESLLLIMFCSRVFSVRRASPPLGILCSELPVSSVQCYSVLMVFGD